MKRKRIAFGSLILLPIITNYFTDLFKIDNFLSNWYFTVAILILIVIGILTYELIHAKCLSFKPKKIDKKKINDLINRLDLSSFQRDIVEVDSWDGYRQESIIKIIDFLENATLLEYKVSDKKLNHLMIDFVSQLNIFSSYTSMHVVSGNNHFIPITREEIDYDLRRAETQEMNRLASISFQKLGTLMEYLRKRNYLE